MSDDDLAAWIGDQRDLMAAHGSRAAGVERRRMKVLWWTESVAVTRTPDVVGLVGRLWSGRRTRPAEEHLFVAVYEPDAPAGARPTVVVRARADDVPEPRGRGLATVVGRAEPGAALLIEARGWSVMPVEPPAEPGDGAPAWTETDAPAR